MTDPPKCPSLENGQTDPSNDSFLSVFRQKRTILTDFLQKLSVEVSVNGHFHPSMIRFGISVNGLSDGCCILVRFLLSVDGLSDGFHYFGPFFIVRRRTL